MVALDYQAGGAGDYTVNVSEVPSETRKPGGLPVPVSEKTVVCVVFMSAKMTGLETVVATATEQGDMLIFDWILDIDGLNPDTYKLAFGSIDHVG